MRRLLVLVGWLSFACGSDSNMSEADAIAVTTVRRPEPFPYGAEADALAGEYRSVSSSGDHTCAIRQDWSLWCWGSNSHGQVGSGTDFEVVGRPTRVGGEVGWERVSAGARHTCAIRLGALYCWGANYYNQLGGGTLSPRSEPLLVSRGGWTEVTTSAYFSCGIRSGQLLCWGFNSEASFEGAAFPPTAIAGAPRFREVVITKPYWPGEVCGVAEDSTLWCADILPNASEVASSVRQVESSTGWTNVHAVGTSLAATQPDGTIWLDGATGELRDQRWKALPIRSSDHFCGVTLEGALMCRGKNAHGQLGNGLAGDAVASLERVGERTDWKAIAVGKSHSCAVSEGGELWCFGSDTFGQLGTDRPRATLQPELVGEGFEKVAVGDARSCGTKQGTLRCWGQFDGLGGTRPDGEQSNPFTSGSAAVASPVDKLLPATLFGVSQGQICSYAEGKLTCFPGSSDLEPFAYDLPGLVQLTLRDWQVCALDAAGDAFCWDPSSSGPGPRLPTGEPWRQVAVGSFHACAIDLGGRLSCWGNGTSGQLGIGVIGTVEKPTPVLSDRSFVQVSAGDGSTCAVDAEAGLWCWGANGGAGTLGTGRFNDELVPVRVGNDFWRQVSVGRHACAVRTDGALFCWGANRAGQLGNPASLGTNVPLRVGDATDWKEVVVAEQHSCAINQDGAVYCWGSTAFGQTGVGEPLQPSPVRVWPR